MITHGTEARTPRDPSQLKDRFTDEDAAKAIAEQERFFESCCARERDRYSPDLFGEARASGGVYTLEMLHPQYQSYTELLHKQHLGWLIGETCPTAQHVIESLTTSAVGDGQEYKVTYHLEPVDGNSQVDGEVQKTLTRITQEFDWHLMQERMIWHYFFIGEFFRRIHMFEDPETEADDFSVQFVPTSRVQPLVTTNELQTRLRRAQEMGEEAYYRHFSDYGILLDLSLGFVDPRRVEAYVVGPESPGAEGKFLEMVPPPVIQHVKDTKSSDIPRGVSRFLKAICNVEGARTMRSYTREMFYARASHAVVEFLRTKQGGLNRMLDKETRNMLKAREPGNTKPLHRPGKRYPKGAKRFTKSDRVELHNLNLDAAGIQNLIELDERMIGRIVNAPDIVALGRSDIGNRETTGNSMKPWYDRIRRTQRMVNDSDAEVLWVGAQIEMNLSNEEVRELKRNYHIVGRFPDPEREIAVEHQTAFELYDRREISGEGLVTRTSRFNYDRQQELLAEETQAKADLLPDPPPPEPGGDNAPSNQS